MTQAVTVCRSLEQLPWHQGMIQEWPAQLRSTYCLVILEMITQVLNHVQRAYISADTTIKQLCHALGCAACLVDIATGIALDGTPEKQGFGPQIVDQESQCRSAGSQALASLSESTVRLHLDAVSAVVLAGIDSTNWQSSRKPLTWQDAPG